MVEAWGWQPCCERKRKVEMAALRHAFCDNSRHDVCAGYAVIIQIGAIHYRQHLMTHLALGTGRG